MTQTPPTLDELLGDHQAYLWSLVAARGGVSLRHESREDLVQGILARALSERGRFRFKGMAEFRGWLALVARSYLADRMDYWASIRRGAGRWIRLTATEQQQEITIRRRPSGPSTVADRKELLVLTQKGIDALPARDRQLVLWYADSLAIEEQARRLGISPESAQRASTRARERLVKTLRLLSQQRPRGG
ncbi:MAG: sigma-70 family RNA polymerase sigma factor [Planctomycetes bacterium]|nr:sigma-70 family RNA polymerase sigma factor [Planctomycetota bacterium]